MPVSRNIYVGALTLAPKPLEYFAIVPSEVGGVGSPRGGGGGVIMSGVVHCNWIV